MTNMLPSRPDCVMTCRRAATWSGTTNNASCPDTIGKPLLKKGLEDLVMDKSNAEVLLLLTPHAVRRPDGYCLNEVARALNHGLQIIPHGGGE